MRALTETKMEMMIARGTSIIKGATGKMRADVTESGTDEAAAAAIAK